MVSAPILLLLLFPSWVHSLELNQPDFLTVRPGQTLTINCKVSYSLTTYTTAWIRQPAGKAPEWIGLIYAGGDIPYKDSLRSKFSLSRELNVLSWSSLLLWWLNLTSVSIACKITGYTAATSCTHWIRHSAGKAPEWLGWFCSTSNTGSKSSLRSRISFTVDASSNTFLQGQNFQPEDTAMFYCARAHSTTHS
ncbi:hypothetical protein AOLI_G00175510 [Acnodon oligacanthus]